ncbi:hypothetical protein RU97_GL000315 [Enterococcus canis]|uniref:3D domain-containing protein n=1 Tax=Enterococcus canis TaxID=214095 RepID=A0A1L8RK59_9ENTE|nr:3D domain-containing protein [Enterococcus canis]OJG20082.1 hypothetical protein RU97_GL000315 [Enterococcus canis]
MKKEWLPFLLITSLFAIGNVLPVYAAEQEPITTTIATADAAKSLSTDLISLTTEGDAVKAVKAEIAAKEKAEKAAKEKADKEKAAKEKAAKEKAAKEKAAKEEAAKEAEEAEAAAETSTPQGETMMMESTAYSYAEGDIGGGTVTALGQDLTQNPMAVAVDPSVIPLGTRLYVEGYGEAIASDTGGAIQGNIIDVHFADPGQLSAWGRRMVKVTILS